jgi:hypothetical protein
MIAWHGEHKSEANSKPVQFHGTNAQASGQQSLILTSWCVLRATCSRECQLAMLETILDCSFVRVDVSCCKSPRGVMEILLATVKHGYPWILRLYGMSRRDSGKTLSRLMCCRLPFYGMHPANYRSKDCSTRCCNDSTACSVLALQACSHSVRAECILCTYETLHQPECTRSQLRGGAESLNDVIESSVVRWQV